MLVIDASVLVKLVVDEAGTESARLIVTANDDCVAPDLLLIEVASALAKKVRFEGLPRAVASSGLKSVPEFVAEIVGSERLLEAATELAVELHHSLFDCLYLALAVERDCMVLTADLKFANAAIRSGYAANIELLR